MVNEKEKDKTEQTGTGNQTSGQRKPFIEPTLEEVMDPKSREEKRAELAKKIELVGDENLRSILRDFLFSDLDDENPNNPDFGTKPKTEIA